MEFKKANQKVDKKRIINFKKLLSVSIIMPVYNAEQTLVKSIESVLQQTYSNFVLIIVNDGSTDNTTKILKKYATNSKIKIINQKNQGVSNARSTGLKNANSDLIAFIDSDDYVLPDFLNNLVVGMLENKVDLCVTGVIYKRNNIDEKSTYLESEDTSKEFISKIFDNDGPKGFLWNKIWNRRIIDRYHIKFDSEIDIAEDLLFSVQYLIHAGKVKVLGTHDYVHIYEPDSLSAGINMNNKSNNYIQPFRQYIKSLKVIVKLINEFDHSIVIYPETELTNACLALLQKIYFTNDNHKYRNLVVSVRHTAKYYHSSLFKNEKVTFTNKVRYVLTIYLPHIMKGIDYVRYSKEKI